MIELNRRREATHLTRTGAEKVVAEAPELARVVTMCQQALGDDLIAVVLFGSRARGEGRKDSDWDVFVLAETLPDDHFDRQLFFRDLMFDHRIFGFSIMAKTREEFEESLVSIYLDIAADAVILFDRDRYTAGKLEEVRRIAREAGLRRVKKRGTWFWVWEEQPEPGTWALDWRNA